MVRIQNFLRDEFWLYFWGTFEPKYEVKKFLLFHWKETFMFRNKMVLKWLINVNPSSLNTHYRYHHCHSNSKLFEFEKKLVFCFIIYFYFNELAFVTYYSIIHFYVLIVIICSFQFLFSFLLLSGFSFVLIRFPLAP